MPSKSLPPPPRPDPVTLEQIYSSITTAGVPLNEKAYHLVALNTVAFHSSVRLFLYEDPSASAASALANKQRRELLVRSIAFFLAQRNNTVAEECRWETISLLGELCRVDDRTSPAGSGEASLDDKLNVYARSNLEYLAQLPWFVPAVHALIAAGEPQSKEEENSQNGGGSSSAQKSVSTPKLSREELKMKLREKQMSGGDADAMDTAAAAAASVQEDDIIALKDILRALPTVEVVDATTTPPTKRCVWSPAAVEQSTDLLFLDASTSLLHLIAPVSRCYSNSCATCFKKHDGKAANAKPFLRCSSCKAVYYCSAECQRQHWGTAHRLPCTSFKDRSAQILEEYYRVNTERRKKQQKSKRSKSGGQDGDDDEVFYQEQDGVVILEVPLEPSLFFETRRFLYDHRDISFRHVSFYDYYMKYNVRGH